MSQKLAPNVVFYFYIPINAAMIPGSDLKRPFDPVATQQIMFNLKGDERSGVYVCGWCSWMTRGFEFTSMIPQDVWNEMDLHVKWHSFDKELLQGNIGL